MSGILSNLFAHKSTQTVEDVVVVDEKKNKPSIPEDSVLRRHFLSQLRADIENTLMPNLTDPNLKHYHEAAIAAEFQKRLSAF